MEKKSLVWLSSAIACVTVLASFTNVVGVQTVISSNNKLINDKVDQKELLFQTILDMANNKEIQKIITISELRRGGFFNKGLSSSVFTHRFLTKKFLNTAYQIGLILSKTLSKTKIHSILERYKVNNQGMQKEITDVIVKNDELYEKISYCNCENDYMITENFPVLCILLYPLFFFIAIIWVASHSQFFASLVSIMLTIGVLLNCFWA